VAGIGRSLSEPQSSRDVDFGTDVRGYSSRSIDGKRSRRAHESVVRRETRGFRQRDITMVVGTVWNDNRTQFVVDRLLFSADRHIERVRALIGSALIDEAAGAPTILSY